MSIVYEAKLRVRISPQTSPALHAFLHKAINTRLDPTKEELRPLTLANRPIELPTQAFWFLRYSRPPEEIWSHGYTEDEVGDLTRTWLAHADDSLSDTHYLQHLLQSTSPFNELEQCSLARLKEHVRTYPKTAFVDDVLFFSHEYSSNAPFDFEQLVQFLNDHRDQQESLLSVFENDDQIMPQVVCHLEGEARELFKGAWEQSYPYGAPICYDRNGYFNGEFSDRPENAMAMGSYQFRPPQGMPFKIDWFNDEHLRLLNEQIHGDT